jgi:squalene monooxygenase
MRVPACDVLIAGGGFAGLVAAASLARAGLSVAVVEQGGSGGEHRLRGELLHPGAVKALEELGFGDALRDAGAASVCGFAAYASSVAEPALLPYPSGSGTFQGFGLEHHVIVGCLRRALASRHGVHLHEGRVQEVIVERGVVTGLRCADGRVFTSPLVVVADGRHSRLRSALGLEATTELLSHSIGTTIDARLLPVPHHGHVFVGGPGPLLAYPIAESEARVNVDVPLDAPRGRKALLDYIATRYAPVVPPRLFQAIVAAFASRPPLGASNHSVMTPSCAVRGAVLLGDSGGCSHPLTATGMTCAVHDAITLASVLTEYPAARDRDRALLAYQERRYRFVRARESFTHALYDVFRADNDGARALRRAVFHYWRSERARRASMAILAGEESRLRMFAAEYALVAGTSAMLGARAALRERSAAPPATALAGVAVAARTAAGLVRGRVATAARARSLAPPAPRAESPAQAETSWPRQRTIRRAPTREPERVAAE